MDLSQVLSLAIFLMMYAAIIIGKVHRMIPALIGAACTILIVFLGMQRNPHTAYSILNISDLWRHSFWISTESPVKGGGLSWQTILFIGGMMVVIEALSRAGLFRWICLYITHITRARVSLIFFAFTLLSALLSMFISSIATMLFMAVTTIQLSRMIRFDPVPMVISEIFASNIGGAATMCGDPPAIIIGTSLGYTFIDFLKNTGPIALAAIIVSVLFFYFAGHWTFISGKRILHSRVHPGDTYRIVYPKPATAITHYDQFWANTAIFILLIGLLISQAQTGLSLAMIALIGASLCLITAGKRARSILRNFDWRTLLFLVGLFICVSGLEETGILEIIAGYIHNLSGDNSFLLISILFWFTISVSLILDNIPLAAVLVPIIRDIAQTSVLGVSPLAWTIALGINIGGNATPISASANVVATAIAEKEGVPFGWGRFCRYAIPATFISAVVIWAILLIKYI